MVATLATLGTHIKPKRRQLRQGPLYFKIGRSTRIRQGKTQPPTKVPITIEESTSKKEEVGPDEGKIEEISSLKIKTKQPVLPVGRPTTREVTFKRLMTQVAMLQEEREELQEKTKHL